MVQPEFNQLDANDGSGSESEGPCFADVPVLKELRAAITKPPAPSTTDETFFATVIPAEGGAAEAEAGQAEPQDAVEAAMDQAKPQCHGRVYCHVCAKFCNGQTQYKDHMIGRKHIKKQRRQQERAEKAN